MYIFYFRLELFADTSSVRPGWLSIGKNFIDSNYDQDLFESWFAGEQMYP